MLIGYARVSTQDQTINLQKDALQKAGCERLFTDTASGAKAERQGLEEALSYLRENDTLVVWRLDRLGRSLKHLIETITDLETRQIGFMSLTENIDTTTSGGKLVFHIFGALAEFERDIIRERTRAGLNAARARGRKGGRPKALPPGQQAIAQTLYNDRTTTIAEICKALGISKATLYRYVDISSASAAKKTEPDGTAKESSATFQAPTRTFAGEMEDRLSARDRKTLSLAKYHRYLAVHPRSRHDLEEAYRQWCRENKAPYVQVRRLRHHAEVSLEFETTEREPSGEACEKAKAALQDSSWAPYTYHWTSKIWSTSRVHLEQAEKLAQTLYEIATRPDES